MYDKSHFLAITFMFSCTSLHTPICLSMLAFRHVNHIHFIQVDVIANSVKPKTSLNEDVLRTSTGGSLAPQFAQRCGPELVDDLSSSNRPCWETGALTTTESYDMDCGEGSPQKVIHFCLPKIWNGSNTYQVCTGTQSTVYYYFGN